MALACNSNHMSHIYLHIYIYIYIAKMLHTSLITTHTHFCRNPVTHMFLVSTPSSHYDSTVLHHDAVNLYGH